MRRSAVQVEVVFLHVLAVIAFVARQSEQTLFEDGIALIPQREGKADQLMAIRDARKSVFVPAVRSGTGVIVREIFPGVSVRAVIFANRAPCAFAEVGTPALPMLLALLLILRAESLLASWILCSDQLK